jgi:hypothetical protein
VKRKKDNRFAGCIRERVNDENLPDHIMKRGLTNISVKIAKSGKTDFSFPSLVSRRK